MSSQRLKYGQNSEQPHLKPNSASSAPEDVAHENIAQISQGSASNLRGVLEGVEQLSFRKAAFKAFDQAIEWVLLNHFSGDYSHCNTPTRDTDHRAIKLLQLRARIRVSQLKRQQTSSQLEGSDASLPEVSSMIQQELIWQIAHYLQPLVKDVDSPESLHGYVEKFVNSQISQYLNSTMDLNPLAASLQQGWESASDSLQRQQTVETIDKTSHTLFQATQGFCREHRIVSTSPEEFLRLAKGIVLGHYYSKLWADYQYRVIIEEAMSPNQRQRVFDSFVNPVLLQLEIIIKQTIGKP